MKHIFLGKAGSHSYGTNTVTSDDDFRGIFVADRKNSSTPFHNQRQYSDPNEKDSVSYEIQKFMELYIDVNPNIVELLWIDESDVLSTSAGYRLLRDNRLNLLSSKCYYTFSGYAYSQLKQMKNQSKWANNPQPIDPPKQYDYVSMVANFTPAKIFNINITEYQNGYRLCHYGSNIYGLYAEKGYSIFNDDGFLNTNSDSFEHTDADMNRKYPLFVIKFNIDEYKRDLEVWSNYWKWKKLKDSKVDLFTKLQSVIPSLTDTTPTNFDIDAVLKMPLEQYQQISVKNAKDILHLCKRHIDFQQDSVDWKHAMHLVRLLKMCAEILEHQQVIVKRPDAQELLDIRSGKWSYDDLLQFAQDSDVKCQHLYKTTKLRKTPDRDLATSLIIQLQDMYW